MCPKAEGFPVSDYRAKLKRVATILGRRRNNEGYWPWLQNADGRILNRLSKKRANKFVLGCIIDYQIQAGEAWNRAGKLAEEIFEDPEDLWAVIARVPKSKWDTDYKWLHRFPRARERVWRIGGMILNDYDGDARLIWRGQAASEVKERFERLRLGTQLTRMAVGALLDTRQIRGTGDLKADLHVRRVLGRIFVGDSLSQYDATRISRDMCASNPWRLDSALFWHGKSVCKATPLCSDCDLRRLCMYASGMHEGAIRTPRGPTSRSTRDAQTTRAR